MTAFYTWALVLVAAAVASADLGTRITIDEAPSTAQVEVRVLFIWTQTCAAVILTNAHVITLASCFSGPTYLPENRAIRVGASVRGAEDGAVFTVNSAINHPSFGELGHDNNIAVVRLNDYLTWGHTVQQAAIIGEGVDFPDNLPVQLVGWGNTAQGSTAASDNDLYRINLFTYNNEDCLVKYLVAEEPETITENMICAGGIYSGRDFDNRDYGAPLFYDNVVIGISNFGISDANDTYPVVTTSIASYTSWIISVAT